MLSSLYEDGKIEGEVEMRRKIIQILDSWADSYPKGHTYRVFILQAIDRIENES